MESTMYAILIFTVVFWLFISVLKIVLKQLMQSVNKQIDKKESNTVSIETSTLEDDEKSVPFAVQYKSQIECLQQIANIDEDYEQFGLFFSQIKRDLTTFEDNRFPEIRKRIEDVLMYNVVDGKKFRGMTLVKCFVNLAPMDAITYQLKEMSYVLGWSSEIVHASGLIYDDIMDNSLTRRGKQCWYLHKNNGVLAINDGSLMRGATAKLCKKYCSDHPCYFKLIDIAMVVSKRTMLGQVMDCLTTPDGKRPDFSLLNEARYETIVAYKTSYYTFVLPIRVAMYLANITDQNMHSDVEKLLLRIGHLFQAQDDYLDIYGEPNVTGKVGTDIEDGKCSWIAVQAYKKMDQKTQQLFEDNYGLKDRVFVIKNIFDTLQMKTVFTAFESKEFSEIQNMIEHFEHKYNIHVEAIHNVLDKMYKRNK